VSTDLDPETRRALVALAHRFRKRQGLISPTEAEVQHTEHRVMRHTPGHRELPLDLGCEADPRRRCACPGAEPHAGCCAAMTAEDLLCDHCRRSCWRWIEPMRLAPEPVSEPLYVAYGLHRWTRR
jgi:hypothetical protein